ncbi:hypothetical protein NOVOSPHI9U_370011 [Novosphingobium sp. 9U]|nr:hypothetical protein NOVOSPHI9U_370011 [Novosphingobium sp. 9U]
MQIGTLLDLGRRDSRLVDGESSQTASVFESQIVPRVVEGALLAQSSQFAQLGKVVRGRCHSGIGDGSVIAQSSQFLRQTTYASDSGRG